MIIFITGQATLHWGRVEFGNIGNYYIVEPTIRTLHETFPGVTLKTTFQLSERFKKEENIEVLPMELYYGFKEDDLAMAEKEYEIALHYHKTGELLETTPYIDAVMECDVFIDYSGDIWGDNADFVGKNRFLVGLYKDRVAQLLGKKTAMLGGSPGPFSAGKNLEFAKEVFKNFDLVTNREAISRSVLEEFGFDTQNLYDLSCPSFLFKKKENLDISTIHPLLKEDREHGVVGVIICGWNFLTHQFDTVQREDADYDFIVYPLMEFLDNNKNIKLCLLSHSNGFIPGKKPFELIHGRDYENIKQLEKILIQKGYQDRIFALDGVYDPWTTKAIVGHFDMLISGRIHGAVAGFSQAVPTVVIEYGNGPIAHKLKGFAREVGVLDYVVDPSDSKSMVETFEKCWKNRESVSKIIKKNVEIAEQKSLQNFELLKELVS